MKHPLPKRSNLFLMEMILAILFFSLASAVCMQLFVKARILSRNTSAKNHAIILAKNAASTFESGDGSLEYLAKNYPGSFLDASELEICYDDDWNPCDRKNSKYQMHITIEEQDGNLTSAKIAVTASDKTELFHFTADCYQPKEAVIE